MPARTDAPSDGKTSPAPPVAARPIVESLAPYQPPVRDERVDLILDFNEGVAPTERARSALASIGDEDLRRYQSPAAFEALVAQRHGIDASRVVVTSGGDDAIDRLCRAVLREGRVMVTHTPSFEMISRWARLAGAEVDAINWMDGPFPTDTVMGRLTDRVALVALVTPNNPTGAVIALPEILAIARAAAARGVVVMVDLAYVEFADQDPTRELLNEPNVVMIRTCSKALGIAGLRVGYAIAPDRVARWMRTSGGPFPCASLSLAVAAACMDDPSTDAVIERTRVQRDDLRSLLDTLGAPAIESGANFLLARFRDADAVHEALLDRGISVRRYAAPGPLRDRLRITLPGEQAAFDRLAAALRDILDPVSTGGAR